MSDSVKREKKVVSKGAHMLVVYSICLMFGIGVFFSLRRFPMSIRWIVAILASIIFFVIATASITRIGDRPVGKTRTINIKDLP